MSKLEKLYNKDCDLREMNPLVLAFLGDSVFDLFVRERLVCNSKMPIGKLNKEKINIVCCKSQAKAINNIMQLLSEEEVSVYKRGRNAHVGHVPKNAKKADYNASTGLEALFGYLYLEGKIERLVEIFNLIVDQIDESDLK